MTANPDSWSFDPFKLTRDGDKLQVWRKYEYDWVLLSLVGVHRELHVIT